MSNLRDFYHYHHDQNILLSLFVILRIEFVEEQYILNVTRIFYQEIKPTFFIFPCSEFVLLK